MIRTAVNGFGVVVILHKSYNQYLIITAVKNTNILLDDVFLLIY